MIVLLRIFVCVCVCVCVCKREYVGVDSVCKIDVIMKALLFLHSDWHHFQCDRNML